MTWSPQIADTKRLYFDGAGFLRGTFRLYFHSQETGDPKYVVDLSEVAAVYDRLQHGAEVRFSDWPQHGSFGWWLPADDPHHSLKITGVEDGNGFFMALAKRIEYRFAENSEWLNWPG